MHCRLSVIFTLDFVLFPTFAFKGLVPFPCTTQDAQTLSPLLFFPFAPQLNRLVQAQRRSARQMLEQLVEVEHSHSSALCRLEEQERNHRAFIQKSDDLTTLLEQDRERLVDQALRGLY